MFVFTFLPILYIFSFLRTFKGFHTNIMVFSCNIKNMQFNKSSPGHPVLLSWGYAERYREGRRTNI